MAIIALLMILEGDSAKLEGDIMHSNGISQRHGWWEIRLNRCMMEDFRTGGAIVGGNDSRIRADISTLAIFIR